MSSSFVKDCSDASSSGNSNANKTVIIIVNNETGNVALDGNELQNLLASHGADTSQVSVVQMGSGGNALSTETAPIFAGSFGAVAGLAGPSGVPVNFMVDGFSAIPLEGSTIGGYAELPLDADALQRLERVLETEEAKQILGEPLLDIVNDPNQLADQLERLMPANADSGKESAPSRKKRAPPKRRSQRQMDKAEREEVEKILAENQLMLRKEREELLREEKQQQQQQEEEHDDDDNDDDDSNPEEDWEENEKEKEGKKKDEAKGRGRGKKLVSSLTSVGGKGKVGKGRGAPNRIGVGVRGRGGKSIRGGKKLPSNEDEEEEGKKKGRRKKPVTPTKQGGPKAVPKALQMKELSVKVKKLNEKLLHEQPQDEEKICSFNLNKKNIPEETQKEGGNTNGESEVPRGHSKGHGRAPLPQLSPTPDKTATQAPITKNVIKKGSKTARKTSVQKGVSDSSLSEVQNVASQSALNKLEVNSTKEPELELNSEIPDTLRPCGDTTTKTTTILSDEKSDIVNVDSKSNCQILIPTQNFSDEEETLNSQKDLSQVKSTYKQTAPDTEFNQSSKQPLIESAVKETKQKNKVTKNVEVLNPKEKNEVFVLHSVIIKNQKENLLEASETLDVSPKKKTPTRQSPVKTVTKVTKTQSQMCKGQFAGGKIRKNLSWKENERENAPQKVIHHQSPTISKSLMNYKIPLKNPGNKRPLLNHQAQSKPPPSITRANLHNPHKFSTSPLPTPTLIQPHKEDDTQPNSPVTTSPFTKILPLATNSPSISSLRSVNKNDSKVVVNKKMPINIKGGLSNHPISCHRQPTSQFNPTSNPQKNNTVTKNHPHIIKAKTVTGNSVIHVKTQNKGNTKIVNKTISEQVSLHGNKLEGFKKSPFKVLPKEKANKFCKMSVGGTQIRRSGRPIKKKSFGDDILFLDEKTPIVSEEEKENSSDSEEAVSGEEKSHNADSASEDDDDDNASDDDMEDDDPERLWCICQKPHNNRFMICCDRCEDWFHGSCVGITKPMGKQMEEEEREWICPNCRKAERAIKGLSTPVKKDVEKMSKTKIKSPEVKITKVIENKKAEKFNKPGKQYLEKAIIKEKTEPRVLVYEKATGIVLSGTAAPTLNILADWLKANSAYTTLQPAMINSITHDPQTGIKKINLEEFGLKPEKPIKVDRNLTFQEKIDSGSPTGVKKDKNRGTKLLKHSEVLQMEANRQVQATKQAKLLKSETDSSPKKRKNSSSVIHERKASIDKAGSGKKSSAEKSELHWKNSLDRPEFTKSNSVDENSSSSNSSTSKKFHCKEFIKDPAPKKTTPLKSPDVIEKVIPKSDVMNVRNSVRKMLFDALEKRKSEVKKEFLDLTVDSIKSLCQEIEEQLFACFNKDVGFKYKSRYRSLMFNIRDTKNSGLYRKILNRTIPPERLAYMTSEELASKELAEWREREEKKELEAIQKHELERLALGNQYIMKSHKGEIVIDKEEFPSKSKDTESVISMAPDPTKTSPDPDLQDDPDMTNHKNHIYDPTCKICSAAASELQEFSSNQEATAGKSETKEKNHSDDSDREKRRRKSSGEGRRESESSFSHHSKHKKRERERRYSYKSRNRDRSRERERERDRSRERDREKDRELAKSRERDREKDREREKSRESDKEKDRERERSKERDKDREIERERSKERDRDRERERHRDKDKNRRSSKDGERRNSKEHHRHERRSSREERKKEEKKRRHSDVRKEDRKRRDSESSHRKRDDAAEDKRDSSEKEENRETSAILLQEGSTPVAKETRPQEGSEEAAEAARTPTEELDVPPSPPPIPYVISPTSVWEGGTPPLPETVPDSPSYSLPDRSPSTPPLPVDIEEDDLLSPATPPLPDDEDRLTPPPSSLPSQRQVEKSVQMPIWKGIISMPDVAKFSAAAFEVSGKALFFTGDVPSVIEVVGRISPETVWNYIAQMKKSGSKEILVVRFQPACEEEKVSYIALYSYLSSKKRYGVIGNCEKSVKDFYVVPLASHQPIPQALLPLDGPGFEESRPHMLIGVIIRMKHRRIYDPRTGSWTTIGEPLQQYNTYEMQAGRDSTLDEESEKSYTPPPNLSLRDSRKRSSSDDEEDELEPFTPSPQSTDGVTLPPMGEERGSKADRESMLAELNRQIERDRKELSEMQRKMDEKMEKKKKKEESPSGGDDDEEDKGSSPTRNEEDGGDSATFNGTPLDTSKINIPSNLHEILDNIKKKEEAIREKENEIKRRLNLQQEIDASSTSGSKDVDLRLILGSGKDQDLRLLARPRGPGALPGTDPRMPPSPHADQDFRSRDPRIPRDVPVPQNDIGNGPTLSAMSDADLVAKAMEMEGTPADGAVKLPFPRVPEHSAPPHMVLGPAGGPPPLIRPPLQEGTIPPNPFGNPSHHAPQFRPPGPFNMNPGPPPGAPSVRPGPLPNIMPMPHAPSYRPLQPHGSPFGPPRPPLKRIPMHSPPEDYHTYQRAPGIDERRPRMKDGGSHPHRGGPWDSRGGRKNWNAGDDGWDHRGWDQNTSDRHLDDDRGRKRTWKESGSGGPPRARWGNVEEDWRGGEGRNWRRDGKKPRKERPWSREAPPHDGPLPQEID